jgi:hypothetical protein
MLRPAYRSLLAGEIPYQSTTTNQQGVEVRSNIEFVEAGFTVDVEGRRDRGETVFKFALEDSSADFSREVDGLPVIRRRVSESIVRLRPGEVKEITRIHQRTDLEAESKQRWIAARDRNNTDKVISIFVQRVDLQKAALRAVPRAEVVPPLWAVPKAKPVRRPGILRIFRRK